MNQSANLLSDALKFAQNTDEPSSVKHLYSILISFANANFWKMPFMLSDGQLSQTLSIDRKTLKTARDRLIELELISYQVVKGIHYYRIHGSETGMIGESDGNDREKYTDQTVDKPRHNAVKRTPKQNKTKQNKTKQTKQNDRSIARAREIENESENEYETFEVDGVINEVNISDGVVKNDTSKNVNGVVNGSKGKAGGVAISDTDKFDQSSVNDDQSLVKFSQKVA